MIIGGRIIVLSFSFFKEGIRDSWQCAISCVHTHQACWRLENSSEMAGGVQHVHSRPLPTHTLTMTRCLQYLQAQTQQKLLIQASRCTSSHWATHSEEYWKKRSKHSYLHVYSLGRFSHTGQELHLWYQSFHSEGLNASLCDHLTFHITAEVIIPHLCVLPVMWPGA